MSMIFFVPDLGLNEIEERVDGLAQWSVIELATVEVKSLSFKV